ncbi:murein hydrolase activator EnvC family protein [Deinococcus arenicola]|uniref:Peptidoglycan DD-metalloendopeptidase family protein n=1 Tax=Deinococcus arenicola TaxID=2994950 RepID=A0ABU4DUM3_9DEIO|nr:peptidoglycan DD-metalloendopeptidase family protein [Deinococcus sp. ZS9-10]MDV6375667.1 peptidoglycan DD-metalloendopeptidase family protein [Deinococcus sp. ZS9-10]
MGRGRALLLLGALLVGQGAGAQTTSQKLEQLQQELQQQKKLSAAQAAELGRIRKAIQNISAQQQDVLTKLDTLAGQIGGIENELAVLNARTAQVEQQLADTTSQLTVTTARVERLKGDVREILNIQYRSRSNDYLGLLSQSRSMSDLLIRLRYANLAGQYNTRIIQSLKDEVATLDIQQAQQAQQAQSLKDIGEKRAAALARLQARRTEQNALLASLRNSEQGQRALATQRQAERTLTVRTIDGLVSQVTAERQRIEAERQRRLEEERKRREEEARRIREAQERARQEAVRLAAIRAEQQRIAEEQAAQRARDQAAQQAQAQAQTNREAQQRAQREQQQRTRESQLQREQQALQQRGQRVQAAQDRVTQELQPLPPTSGPLGFPLPGGRIVAPYGSGGSPWVVLAGDDTSQAVAALEGNVLAVTYYASLGWVVLVDHSNAISAYFGLSEPLVSVGNRVARGTPLGTVGGSQIIGPQRMAFQYRLNGVSVVPAF